MKEKIRSQDGLQAMAVAIVRLGLRQEPRYVTTIGFRFWLDVLNLTPDQVPVR